MIVIDSCGWVEYLTQRSLAQDYAPYLADPELVVPTIVIYEVHKFMVREVSEAAAARVAARMKDAFVIHLDLWLAMEAAEVSLKHELGMADAVVYATARMLEATLVTSDEDFADLPGVTYIPRDSG